MNRNDRSKNQTSGAFIAVGASAGSILGAWAAVTTGDWSRMPLILSACIGLGAIAAWQTQRGLRR